MSLTPPFNQTRVTGASEVLVAGTRCALIALIPEKTTTGTVAVKDDSAVSGSTTAVHTSDVGLTQQGKYFGTFGVRMANGITVTLSAGTDAVTVVWVPY